jgi:hypothetical protein
VYKNCTRKPNSHLPCHNFAPPVTERVNCERQNVIHVVERVQPASSTTRMGNCPNHRSDEFWFAHGKKFTKPRTGGRGPVGAGPATRVVW